MSRPYRGGQGQQARPENALQRSDQLYKLGTKPQIRAALQVLHDVMTNRRKSTWTKTYEAIMMRHVELCVELKLRILAKEALQQYRNLCHQINAGSLEEVIRHFLKKAEEKAQEAQLQAAVSREGMSLAAAGATSAVGPACVSAYMILAWQGLGL
jgi:translation initiation factor 3 subunit A